MRLITKSKIKEYVLSELASNGSTELGDQPQAIIAVLSVQNPMQAADDRRIAMGALTVCDACPCIDQKTAKAGQSTQKLARFLRW